MFKNPFFASPANQKPTNISMIDAMMNDELSVAPDEEMEIPVVNMLAHKRFKKGQLKGNRKGKGKGKGKGLKKGKGKTKQPKNSTDTGESKPAKKGRPKRKANAVITPVKTNPPITNASKAKPPTTDPFRTIEAAPKPDFYDIKLCNGTFNGPTNEPNPRCEVWGFYYEEGGKARKIFVTSVNDKQTNGQLKARAIYIYIYTYTHVIMYTSSNNNIYIYIYLSTYVIFDFDFVIIVNVITTSPLRGRGTWAALYYKKIITGFHPHVRGDGFWWSYKGRSDGAEKGGYDPYSWLEDISLLLSLFFIKIIIWYYCIIISISITTSIIIIIVIIVIILFYI